MSEPTHSPNTLCGPRVRLRRIGLAERGAFDHPRLEAGHLLRRDVLYANDAAGVAPAAHRAIEPGVMCR